MDQYAKAIALVTLRNVWEFFSYQNDRLYAINHVQQV